MADDKQEVKKDETSDVPEVCALDVDDIFVDLHLKAIEKIKSTGCVIVNSAMEGKGKNVEFYGPGKHIIAALPDAKDKDSKLSKQEALKAITTYVQWFSGPDVAGKITEKDLQMIEGDGDSTADDTPKSPKKEKPKDDGKKPEPAKESVIPTFSLYMLLEDGEADKEDEKPKDSDDESDDKSDDKKDGKSDSEEDKPEDKDKEKDKDEDKKEDDSDLAPGWYLSYTVEVEGRSPSKWGDIFGKFSKMLGGLAKKIGFRTFTLRGGGESGFTIGDVVDKVKGMFGGIDPAELQANFQKELKKKFPLTSASSEIFDAPTIKKHLKGRLGKSDIPKVQKADLSFCIKVHKDDKSKKVINTKSIAGLVTHSIKGIFKTFKNAVSKNDVILVNGYDENDKSKNKAGRQLSLNTNDDKFDESIEISLGNILSEADETKKSVEDVKTEMSDYFQGQADKLFSELPTHKAEIKSSKDIVEQIRQIGADDEKSFNLILQHANAFMLELEYDKPKENDDKKDVSASNKKLYAGKMLLEMLLEAIEKAPDDIKNNIEKIFSNLANNNSFLTARGKKAPEETEIYEFTDETKKESMKIASSIYNMLFEDDSYIFEGHSKEQLAVDKQLDEIGRIGLDNLSENIQQLRKNYLEHLKKVKAENKDNKYVLDIKVNAENWINAEFISKLRDLPSIDAIKKLLKSCVGRVGKTDDKKFELDALLEALKKLPAGKKEAGKFIFKAPKDPEKPDDLQTLGDPIEYEEGKTPDPPDPPEFDGYEFEKWDPDPSTLKDKPDEDKDIVATYKKKDSDEKITITFKDIDDPSELSNPEEPSDEDKKKYKTVGEPLEIVPGEDVKIPEVKNKGKFEFMGFEPDPENMDETGETYAMYTRNGPDTVKISFYDADPEKNEKTGDPIKEIEVEKGQAINANDKASSAIEELNKKFLKEEKEGYTLKGWNIDPATKAEEDTDMFPKYIKKEDEDKTFTVSFLYPPDPENKDKVEEIPGDDATQKVKAGEAAKAPEPPEIEGWKFKKWDSDFSNVTDDMVVLAEYQKPGLYIFKAPKDPEKPDDLQTLGDPIEFEDGKEPTPPDPPTFDGYEFEKWDPDPKDFKDGFEGDKDIVATYKKKDDKKPGLYIFKAPKDPEKPDELELLGDPIEFEEGKTPDPPDPPEFDGYEFEKWDPDPSTLKDKPEEDVDIIAVYKKADGKEAGNYIFKAPKDPEKPDGEFDIVDEIAFEEGKTPTPPSAPDREGYEFEKWDPDPSTLKDKPEEDVDIIAVYKKKDEKTEGDKVHAFYVLPDYAGILDEDEKVKITFKIPEANKDDPTKIDDISKLVPAGDPVDITKGQPLDVDKETGAIKQGEDEIVTPPDLSKAGYKFEKWIPDPSKGFDTDTDVEAHYKENKRGQAAELKLNSGNYDFYIIPMPGLKYKDDDDDKK